MSTETHKYHIRYAVGPWDKPVPDPTGRKVIPGVVRTSNEEEYGYCDYLFMVSGVEQPDGRMSLVPMDTDNGVNVSRENLESIRDFINHLLEHHVT